MEMRLFSTIERWTYLLECLFSCSWAWWTKQLNFHGAKFHYTLFGVKICLHYKVSPFCALPLPYKVLHFTFHFLIFHSLIHNKISFTLKILFISRYEFYNATFYNLVHNKVFLAHKVSLVDKISLVDNVSLVLRSCTW